ncbi:hypothetical protein COCCADRAFT_111470 [Bipolaris zeicola 26-R-13]|uniref:Uncharacterized protein n=1 Tax=Cochliobolus carbonum (strain 26-R-13) TaxID=930089 RepID=W6Y8W9_COCC2|nr:uncharacterized protein COCCADRAFT_111470 [Bipolaris zeicola 26-R-13]EUC27526.1 hypothetical protein COCCADRAFT_111470 [Bipolaris zeicola 26-R-13]
MRVDHNECDDEIQHIPIPIAFTRGRPSIWRWWFSRSISPSRTYRVDKPRTPPPSSDSRERPVVSSGLGSPPCRVATLWAMAVFHGEMCLLVVKRSRSGQRRMHSERPWWARGLSVGWEQGWWLSCGLRAGAVRCAPCSRWRRWRPASGAATRRG